MCQQLLTADVVIADLSTYNCKAFYELGIRHTLRPYTTITIAEEKMAYPFDVNHAAIRRYQHLGEGIDFEEVERMRRELTNAIQTIAAKPVNDSPVYQFLTNLEPPSMAALPQSRRPFTSRPPPTPSAPSCRQLRMPWMRATSSPPRRSSCAFGPVRFTETRRRNLQGPVAIGDAGA